VDRANAEAAEAAVEAERERERERVCERRRRVGVHGTEAEEFGLAVGR